MRGLFGFFMIFTLLFFGLPSLCFTRDQTLEPTQTVSAVSLPETVTFLETSLSTADFLVGMLAAKDVPHYHLEALKALTVVNATQLFSVLEQNKRIETLPYRSPEQTKQDWGAYWFAHDYPTLQQAVAEVYGQALLENGSWASVQSFALSWGQTEAGVVCEYDKTASNFKTTVTIPLASLCEALPSAVQHLSVKKARNGRVESVVSGSDAISGQDAMQRWELPSPAFSVVLTETQAVFTCHGQGDGKGMSRYAANELAKRGEGYRSILTRFFPTASLASPSE